MDGREVQKLLGLKVEDEPTEDGVPAAEPQATSETAAATSTEETQKAED